MFSASDQGDTWRGFWFGPAGAAIGSALAWYYLVAPVKCPDGRALYLCTLPDNRLGFTALISDSAANSAQFAASFAIGAVGGVVICAIAWLVHRFSH